MNEAVVALTTRGRAMRAAVYLSQMYQKKEELFLPAPTTVVALLVVLSGMVDFALRWHSRGLSDRLRCKDMITLEEAAIVARTKWAGISFIALPKLCDFFDLYNDSHQRLPIKKLARRSTSSKTVPSDASWVCGKFQICDLAPFSIFLRSRYCQYYCKRLNTHVDLLDSSD